MNRFFVSWVEPGREKTNVFLATSRGGGWGGVGCADITSSDIRAQFSGDGCKPAKQETG